MNIEEVKEFKEIINIILEYRKSNCLSVDQRNRLSELVLKQLPRINDVGDDEELIEKALFIIGDRYSELEKEFQMDIIQRRKISSIIKNINKDINETNYPFKIDHIIDQSNSKDKFKRMLVVMALERCRERIRLAREKSQEKQNYAVADKKITDSLLKFIEDDDPDVRFAAIEACSKIEDPAVIKALKKSINSKDTFVRIAAEGALSSFLKKRHGL